jgi:hypothetical protein
VYAIYDRIFYVLLFVWFFRKSNVIHHTGLYIITKRQVHFLSFIDKTMRDIISGDVISGDIISGYATSGDVISVDVTAPHCSPSNTKWMVLLCYYCLILTSVNFYQLT